MKFLFNCWFPPEGSLQLWRTSAVKSSRAARAILPGQRGSAPSVSPVPSRSTDRCGRQRAGAVFSVRWWFEAYRRPCPWLPPPEIQTRGQHHVWEPHHCRPLPGLLEEDGQSEDGLLVRQVHRAQRHPAGHQSRGCRHLRASTGEPPASD